MQIDEISFKLLLESLFCLFDDSGGQYALPYCSNENYGYHGKCL